MSNKVLNAATLSNLCYSLPENGNRQILNKWHDSSFTPAEGGTSDVFSIRIPLQYNLIGESGNITVCVSVVGKRLYIAIEGTQDIETWLYNLNRESVSFEGWIRFHRGFLDYATGVRDYLLADSWFKNLIHSSDLREIVCCGHSAGGAAASILPYVILEELSSDICPPESIACRPMYWQVIDFGSPPCWKKGDNSISPLVARMRFEHQDDIVPALLRIRGYRHYGAPYFLPSKHPNYALAHERPFGLTLRKWGRVLWNALRKKSIIAAVAEPHSMDTYNTLVRDMFGESDEA